MSKFRNSVFISKNRKKIKYWQDCIINIWKIQEDGDKYGSSKAKFFTVGGVIDIALSFNY